MFPFTFGLFELGLIKLWLVTKFTLSQWEVALRAGQCALEEALSLPLYLVGAVAPVRRKSWEWRCGWLQGVAGSVLCS